MNAYEKALRHQRKIDDGDDDDDDDDDSKQIWALAIQKETAVNMLSYWKLWWGVGVSRLFLNMRITQYQSALEHIVT